MPVLADVVEVGVGVGAGAGAGAGVGEELLRLNIDARAKLAKFKILLVLPELVDDMVVAVAAMLSPAAATPEIASRSAVLEEELL